GATMIYVTHDQVEAMTLGDRLVLMQGGVVRQQGAPLEVYRRPANRFAATFIGSPAMNLFEGAVRGGVFHLAAGAGRCPAAGLPDGPAVLGVRPEDLLIVDGGADRFASGRVQSVERLGHETLLWLDVGDNKCAVRAAGEVRHEAGDTVELSIRPAGRHLFTADEGGERLDGDCTQQAGSAQ
ncbi:MAG: TOBE domain-containing protein, partial [Planctomycetota bacterium]